MFNISVVTCVKNEEKRIERLLKSVLMNNPLEIVIIDDLSSDNTVKIAKKYTDNIFSTEGKGLAYGRQLGAQKAEGEYIAYIDADMELPDSKILSKMMNELQYNKWIAIQSQLTDPRENKNYWAQGEDFHWQNRLNKPGERSFMGIGMCIISREMILKNKFDYNFKGAAEDADFFARLRKEGHKYGVSTAISYHYHRTSFKKFFKQRMWYGKGNAKAMVKHNAITLFFAPFAILIYGTVISIYNKRFKFIFFYIIWTFFLFYGTILGLLDIIMDKS